MLQVCIKCGVKFNFIRSNGNGNNKRKHCLKCVPAGMSYGSLFSLNGKEFICKKCGKPFIYRAGRHTNSKVCLYCCRRKYRDRNNAFIDSIKKSGCIICGYKQCSDALVFHHRDLNEKDFSISKGASKSLESVKAEINKCIVICSNCHAEVHAGLIKLAPYVK